MRESLQCVGFRTWARKFHTPYFDTRGSRIVPHEGASREAFAETSQFIDVTRLTSQAPATGYPWRSIEMGELEASKKWHVGGCSKPAPKIPGLEVDGTGAGRD